MRHFSDKKRNALKFSRYIEQRHGKEKQPSVFSLRGTRSGKKLQLSFNYEKAASSELKSGLVSCVRRLLQLLSCSHYLKKTVRRRCQISVFTLSPRTSKYTQAVMNYIHVEPGARRACLSLVCVYIKVCCSLTLRTKFFTRRPFVAR